MTGERNSATQAETLAPSSLESDSTRWRIFCAIELPRDVCNQANDHIQRLRASLPNARASWISEGKFHLTIKFLGDIPRGRVASLSLAAAQATRSISPFKLAIEGAGAFPRRGPAKVLWLGVRDSSRGLALLHQCLEAVCAQAGFARDERSFQPHLTLARIREPQGARPLASLHNEIGFAAVEFTVTELQVIRSVLRKSG